MNTNNKIRIEDLYLNSIISGCRSGPAWLMSSLAFTDKTNKIFNNVAADPNLTG